MSRSNTAEQHVSDVAHLPQAKPRRKSKAKSRLVLVALLCAGFGTGAAITHDETSACHHQPPAALSVSNGK